MGGESAPGEPLAWVDPWPGLVGDTVAYGPVEGHPAIGRAWRELLVPRGELAAALGDRPLAGTWAAEALRIAAWRPRLGFETDHRTIPHEVDWLRTAVHLHKGCYRGQETIARVHNLGRPPRRLVFLHLDGSGHVLPDAGSPVFLGEREVGRLTSVGRHHEDGPVALAVDQAFGGDRRGSSRGRHLGRADRRRERLIAADPAAGSCHDGGMAPVAPAATAPTGTLITVAPTGAEHAKADLPQLPTTLEELVETARRCEAAGASLIHLHLRDGEHRPTLDAGRLRDAVDALRTETDLVVQLSTGGSVHDPLEQRLTVLDAEPDSCSLTCGTTNFGDDVFLNPWGFMSDLYVQAQEREVVPEFELFDLGHVHALRRLLDTHGLPFGGRVHVDFVTGVPGGMPATTAALMAGVAMLPAEVTSWSATGIGRGHLPIMAAALSAGGHLRVGMEDNVVFARGQVVQHNDELVARAAELATVMQRPPLGTAQARELLGVKERRSR